MRTKVWFEAQARNYKKTANGVRWEAVIFSSEFNRNRAYFDIQKMMRWAGKLEKILMNNDHDGKYFSNTTDKIVEIRVETDDSGVTECYAVVESINEEKINDPESVTGFSIELMVEPEDVISNENGEYYKDYEWVGMAYLRGQLAGSGDTRLLSMKTFADNTQSHMDENQVKEIVSEAVKAQFELVSKDSSKTEGSWSWMGEDGKMYTTTWESVYSSMTTAEAPTEGEALKEYNAAREFIKAFALRNFDDLETKVAGSEEGEGENSQDPTNTDESKSVEMSLDKTLAQKNQDKMKKFNKAELVTPEGGDQAADPIDTKSFLNKFRK